MRVLRLRRVLRQGLVASIAALAATSAFAQDENAIPAEPEAPAVTPDGPAARRDSIDAYQVRIAESGYMAGRLQVVDSLTGEVRGIRKTGLLFIQNGKVVGRGETGVSGVAQIKRLPVGAYSAVALGPDGMAAFGFEVLPPADGVAVSAYRFDALIVPASDVAVAQRTICSGGDFAATPLPLPAPPEPLSPLAVALKAQVDGPITPAPLEEGFDYESASEVAAPLKGQPILVQDGESGVGQLVVLAADGQPMGLENARVSFIRSGQLLGTVETDSRGYCGVLGLEDGIYSMVGVGQNGFIALGVRVQTFAGSATAKTQAADEEFVSARQVGAPVVGWRAAGATSDALAFAPGFACGSCGQSGCCGQCAAGPCGGPCDSFGAGGYGSGFGGGGFGGAGGGGGFFGGGLLGPLLGVGIGAAIGAAIADDDDDDGDDGGFGVSPNAPPN
ncbi:MAG: hypothetical protein M3552_22190 [Planctomycetota bacterium]|nr:hypothetical protein [Planctomycetota bacterium]